MLDPLSEDHLPRRGRLLAIAGKRLRRALSRHPAESRFFLFLTGMGAFGLLLQKETLVEALGYAVFWCGFMLTMLAIWHDELFDPDA